MKITVFLVLIGSMIVVSGQRLVIELYSFPFKYLADYDLEESIDGAQGYCEPKELYQVMDIEALDVALGIPACIPVNWDLGDGDWYNFSISLACIQDFDLVFLSHEDRNCQGRVWTFNELQMGLEHCFVHFNYTELSDIAGYIELFSYRMLCRPSDTFLQQAQLYSNYSLHETCESETAYGRGFQLMDSCIWNSITNFTDMQFFYNVIEHKDSRGKLEKIDVNHWQTAYCEGPPDKVITQKTSECLPPEEIFDDDKKRRNIPGHFLYDYDEEKRINQELQKELKKLEHMKVPREYFDALKNSRRVEGTNPIMTATSSMTNALRKQLQKGIMNRAKKLLPFEPYNKFDASGLIFWGGAVGFMIFLTLAWIPCCCCAIGNGFIWKVVLNGKDVHWKAFF